MNELKADDMQRKATSNSYWQPDSDRLLMERATRDSSAEHQQELDQAHLLQGKPGVFSDTAPFFLLDFERMKFLYVSKSVKNVTGYSPEEFLNEGFSFCYKLWHPNDISNLRKLHQRLFCYYYATPVADRSKLKFTYNFRLRRRDATYMDILQQTLFVKIGINGKPLLEFSTLTDITPFKRDHHLTLHIQKLNTRGEYEQVYKEEFKNYTFAFTRRQLEIMALISRGLTTKEIAAILFLSVDTVKNHRKNILKMTGSKNVVEVYRTMEERIG